MPALSGPRSHVPAYTCVSVEPFGENRETLLAIEMGGTNSPVPHFRATELHGRPQWWCHLHLLSTYLLCADSERPQETGGEGKQGVFSVFQSLCSRIVLGGVEDCDLG